MLKMVDGTGIIGVDMVCPLGGAVSPPQPPNYDKVEVDGVGSLMLSNSLKAPLERVELLGNSTQGENPAPDNPQEIKSCGRKSKNIFNKNAVKQGYEFESAASDAETVKQGWFVSDFMPVKATTYQISGKKTGAGCKLYSKDKVFVKNIQVQFGQIKIEEGIAYFRINGEIKDLDNIQVEEGTVATDYEPYSDTCLLDVKVTGKNLFNAEKARDITNWIVRDNDGYAKFPIRVGKGNKVTFSYTEKLTAGKGFYLGITQSETSAVVAWLYHSAETNLNNNKHTVVAAGDYIYLSCTKSGIQKFVDTIQTLQVEISSVQTPYEPYTEQALTLTSDRPITKWDKLVEQGGQYGWLYQSVIDSNVKPSRTDLFPNGFSLFKDFGNGVYVYKVTNIKKAIGFQTSLCEQFKNKDGSYSTGDLFCYSDQPSMQMQYFVTDIPTLEEFKTWMEANSLTMVYKTTQTEFVPLSQEEQTQLRNLHSYNGTTNITVDSGEVPCGIKLTYRKEI